jgi:hypothetical protein
LINFIYRFLDLTLGKLVRLVSNLSVQKKFRVEVPSVYDLVLRRSREDSADYVVNMMPLALYFQDRESLWQHCIQIVNEKLSTNDKSKKPLLLEFGVFEGKSLKYFERNFLDAEIHGFDSFRGLEEEWYGYIGGKGTFDLGGNKPELGGSIQLHDGWFEDTLPSFLTELSGRQIDILHCDADTYKPTSYILNNLINNLRKGSIVIFDEYFGYPSWRMHEFKAWKEVVELYNINYTYLGYSSLQVAIQIQ